MGTAARTVTLNTTQLTPALIATAGALVLIVSRIEVLLMLPCLVVVGIVALIVPFLIPRTIVLVVCRTLVRDRIPCNGQSSRDVDLSLKLEFMVDKLLMDICYGWRSVTSLYLIDDCFVFLWNTTNEIINLIFMIDWFPKKGNVIKPSREPLDIFINRFSSFSPVFHLLLQLLDMAPSWSGVCVRKGTPELAIG